jgi:cytochrome c peroxidase
VSCASCHDPDLAFTDGRRLAEGIKGRVGERNSPTILNAMFSSSLFWDGRTETLEAQAREPLINPVEMGNESYDQVVGRLRADPDYARQFQEVFGGPVTIEAISQAIASYERTLVSANSPYDRFLSGDRDALSAAAFRGLAVFRSKGRCAVCHRIDPAFPFFTDLGYRNTGVAMNNPRFEELANLAQGLGRDRSRSSILQEVGRREGGIELGRFLVSGNVLDIGAFRTPTLRNVELTAPYFHDGSAAALKDVVAFYTKGGNDNPARDWELQAVSLTEDDQADLIEFLKALTSSDLKRR